MKRMIFAAIMMGAISLTGLAQQPAAAEPNHVTPPAQELGHDQRFRLTFIIRETDENGKALNSREYETMIGAIPHRGDPNASIRTGARVPVPTGAGSLQFTYLDIGVNFDINSFQVLSATRVAMDVHADLSSIDPVEKQIADHPVIRQNKWSGSEQMVLGERKTIFSSDDLTSKNRVQVELTVTRID